MEFVKNTDPGTLFGNFEQFCSGIDLQETGNADVRRLPVMRSLENEFLRVCSDSAINPQRRSFKGYSKGGLPPIHRKRVAFGDLTNLEHEIGQNSEIGENGKNDGFGDNRNDWRSRDGGGGPRSLGAVQNELKLQSKSTKNRKKCIDLRSRILPRKRRNRRYSNHPKSHGCNSLEEDASKGDSISKNHFFDKNDIRQNLIQIARSSFRNSLSRSLLINRDSSGPPKLPENPKNQKSTIPKNHQRNDSKPPKVTPLDTEDPIDAQKTAENPKKYFKNLRTVEGLVTTQDKNRLYKQLKKANKQRSRSLIEQKKQALKQQLASNWRKPKNHSGGSWGYETLADRSQAHSNTSKGHEQQELPSLPQKKVFFKDLAKKRIRAVFSKANDNRRLLGGRDDPSGVGCKPNQSFADFMKKNRSKKSLFQNLKGLGVLGNMRQLSMRYLSKMGRDGGIKKGFRGERARNRGKKKQKVFYSKTQDCREYTQKMGKKVTNETVLDRNNSDLGDSSSPNHQKQPILTQSKIAQKKSLRAKILEQLGKTRLANPTNNHQDTSDTQKMCVDHKNHPKRHKRNQEYYGFWEAPELTPTATDGKNHLILSSSRFLQDQIRRQNRQKLKMTLRTKLEKKCQKSSTNTPKDSQTQWKSKLVTKSRSSLSRKLLRQKIVVQAEDSKSMHRSTSRRKRAAKLEPIAPKKHVLGPKRSKNGSRGGAVEEGGGEVDIEAKIIEVLRKLHKRGFDVNEGGGDESGGAGRARKGSGGMEFSFDRRRKVSLNVIDFEDLEA